uniref:Uncharacterized protein n=1 Tax=Salarias fasciatus TaxID=181472 RepID=A0A672JK11_SALFA
MRVFVLALAVALVVPEFAPDQIYVYKYEAKLMGGMPEEGLARAGVKILSKVQLHADSSNNLDAPQFFEYKGKWAKDDSITANFTQHLTPVKFQYTNGNVGKVYAPANTQNVYELQELSVSILTKTKDLNQCQDKVVNDIGLSYMEKCPECERKSRALNGASFYNYTLKPEANSARLLEATVTEIYQYAPFETMHGGPQMESRQFFSLIQQNTEYNQSSTLLYEFGSEVYQTPFSLLDPSSRLERSDLSGIRFHLGSSNRDRVHEESPLKYIALIQLLREAQYERILTVWNQIKDNQDQRHWILNAIPAIRSHVALQFVMDRFLKKELSSLEAAHVLLVSVHLVKASNEAIKFAQAKHSVLWNIVLLGYGTLVAKQCVENPGCSSDLVKPFHERLAQAVERQEIEKIITSLKVLGNAGHLASYKPIQKVLPGFGSTAANLPLRVHIEAVLALRNIAKNHPRPVQETVIQLFMSKEHQELRMAAAIVLFETKPSTGLVMTLANAIAKENNDQISSFIYSYMKSMTKSAAPDFESVSAACSLAIRVLSPRLDRQSYRYSRSLYADTYNSAAFLPKTVVAKARAYLAGAYADVLEIGVRSEGIQEALVKNQNIPQNEQRVNKMKAILKALSSWKAEPSSQPLASAYVKIFGQEVAYGSFENLIVEQISELAKEVRPEIILREVLQKLMSGYKHYYAQPLLLSEIRRILPTAIGLPMSLSLYTSAVVVVPVNVKVDPPLARENFRLAQLLKSDIRMSAVITPSVSAHTYAVMGVNTDQFKAAVMSRARVHSVVPAKMEARVDMTGGNFKLELLPVQGITKLAKAELETFAVVGNMNVTTLTPLIPAERADRASSEAHKSQASRMASSLFGSQSRSSELLHPGPKQKGDIPLPKSIGKKRCLESKPFGYKICGETQAYNASYISASPLYSMIGKHVAELAITPATGTAVEKIEVEIQVGQRSADKIMKVISRSEEEEILESKNVLLKLKKILIPGLNNGTSSSSSSSSSQSTSSSSSSSRSSLSNSSSSQSSSSSSSRKIQNSAAGSRRRSNSRSSKRLSQDKKSSSSSRSSSSSQSSSQSRSSSSSSSSSSQSKVLCLSRLNVRFFFWQHALSTGRANSKSSAYSFETIYNKAKYLAKSVAPIVTVLIRGVTAEAQGYQIAAYVDKVTSRLQVIVANLARDNNWRLCADGVVLSNHKLMGKVGWGSECKQYKAEITAETGVVDQKPAARLKMSWEKLPSRMQLYMKWLSKFIGLMAEESGLSIARTKYLRNQIKLTVAAASEKSVNVALQTSKTTIYRLGVGLPMSLPIGQSAYDVNTDQNLAGNIINLVAKATSVRTFNGNSFSSDIPHLCPQILSQDCTAELKFMVLLKKDQATNQYEVNVKIGLINVDFYLKNGAVKVSVDGSEITRFPYEHPNGKISIRQRSDGVALVAPSFGLQEVEYTRTDLKVQVAHWMKGKTCGLCGPADGEVRQGYRKPDKSLTRDPVSFAHSWVLGGDSCRDTTQCLMRLESVKLEKQVNVFGQNSKCYSVEPVLRCLAGCMPVRTTTVSVGYHCVPSDSYMSRPNSLNSIQEKSIDLVEATEAHVACRCTAQCS